MQSKKTVHIMSAAPYISIENMGSHSVLISINDHESVSNIVVNKKELDQIVGALCVALDGMDDDE